MPDYRDYGQQDDQQTPDGDAQFMGVNARLQPDQLGPGVLADGQNVRLRNGIPETRQGVMKPGWLNVTNASVDNGIRPVGRFYGCGVFKDPNGSEWVLLAADGNIYRCKPNNARFSLPLPPAVVLTSTCVPVQAFNLVYLFRGKYLAPLVMRNIDDGFEDLMEHWSSGGSYQAAVLADGTPAVEVAYGPFQAASITSDGQTATVTTVAEHGYVTGADITVQGATQPEYNGRFNITVVDANTFTYQFAGSATSPATGTIKVSNMSNYWQAKGSLVTLTSLTSVATVATATKVAHGFTAGQTVTIAGANQVEYNGTFVITGALANTFTYDFAGSTTSPATGTITARTSVVLAGQSPDTNPEAWTQIYNVLPNADDALFVDNRLLVPTAYTPGVTGYDSTSTYTKKDFIVAMDIGDDLHFLFTNEFRINQGNNDEIVTLVKFDADTVVVIKSKSWAVLRGLESGDLADVKLDMKPDTYGGCAPRSGVCAGKNVLFPSTQRGICGLLQSQMGETRSVDVPFSNDIDGIIELIDWRQADKIRLAWWDDKLFCAVPINLGTYAQANLIPSGAVYTATAGPPFHNYTYTVSGLIIGQSYHYTPGYNDASLSIITGFGFGDITTYTGETTFVYNGGTVVLANSTATGPVGPFPDIPVTAKLTSAGPTGNNAILVFDFRRGSAGSPLTYDFTNGQWDGYDWGTAICVQEFFLATYVGRQRLFYIGTDGYANIMEEAEGSDQVRDDGSPTKLSWEDIQMSVDTRGYNIDKEHPQEFRDVSMGLEVWNASFSILLLTGQTSFTKQVRQDYTFSRTKYLKPVGKMAYVEGNTNNDFFTPGRGDYSVRLLPMTTLGAAGITPGYSTEQFQEITVTSSTRSAQGRFVQFRITNKQGRLRIKAVVPVLNAGMRRKGVKI